VVSLFFIFIFNIEKDFDYLQEELLFLKERPVENIQEIEKIPYLDELTIKKIKAESSFSEIDKKTMAKIKPFIKLAKEKKPKFYYYFNLKNGEIKNKVKYFSIFDYQWEGKKETISHYLKFRIKDFDFHIGDFTFARSLFLIFAHPYYLPIIEYQNLYQREVLPATIYKKNKSFFGFLITANKNLLTKLLITDKVFGLFEDFSIGDFKNGLNLFYFLKEKIGFSYSFKKYFGNSFCHQEIAYTNKKEFGYAVKIFFHYNFFSYQSQFAYLNKNLSPYTYYQKRDFPYFQINIKNDFSEIAFQIEYLSFFNYDYDSLPHKISFIFEKENENFDWQLKINRYFKLTRIRKWSNSFLIKRNFKNLTFGLFLADYYQEEKKLKRKYLLSPRIKAKIKNWEISFYYYLNYFNEDMKVYNFEEEILAEHSLKENIKNRYVSQINCYWQNFSLKFKLAFDKEIEYLTYFLIKI